MPERTGQSKYNLLEGEFFYNNKGELIKGKAEVLLRETNTRGVMEVIIEGVSHFINADNSDQFGEIVIVPFDLNNNENAERDRLQDDL